MDIIEQQMKVITDSIRKQREVRLGFRNIVIDDDEPINEKMDRQGDNGMELPEETDEDKLLADAYVEEIINGKLDKIKE
jgi:hypothetical protein